MDTEATFLSFFLVPLIGKNYIFLNSLSFVICMEKTKSDLADFQLKKHCKTLGSGCISGYATYSGIVWLICKN